MVHFWLQKSWFCFHKTLVYCYHLWGNGSILLPINIHGRLHFEPQWWSVELASSQLSFSALTELVVCLFVFYRKLVRTGSHVFFLVLSESVSHSEYSKKWLIYEISIPFSYAPLPPPIPLWPFPPLPLPPLSPRLILRPRPLKCPSLPLPRSPRPVA